MTNNSKEKIISLDIPQGYQMTFTTWENDADYYAEKTISGLTEEDVFFYKDLASYFSSVNNGDNEGLGNEEHTEEELIFLMNELLDRHPQLSESERLYWEKSIQSEEVYSDLCDKILSHPVEYDYMFCRVMDNVKIFYVEKPIFIQEKIENVTDKFDLKSKNKSLKI